MIQAKDLRIGNYVVFSEDGTIFKVIEISEKGLGIENRQEITWIEMETFDPIPLTEEILLKCGFEKKGKRIFKGWFYLWEENGLIVFALAEMHDEIGCYLSIKSVHQLQNLYWCLCGEELEINL